MDTDKNVKIMNILAASNIKDSDVLFIKTTFDEQSKELEKKENKLSQRSELIKETTENVFDILKQNGFDIKEKKDTFQRTEQLLYLVPKLKESIKLNESRIKDLKEYGVNVIKKGSAVHIVSETTPEKKEDEEIIDLEVSKLKQRNHIILSQINWINSIIKTLEKEKYFKIIDLKYYKCLKNEEIAIKLECDVKTITRNKTKYINSLKSLLFPYDSIDELGY